MKTIEEKQRFIELRAQGFSFDRIAEELNISKPTLLSWSGELFEQVQEAVFHEQENLLNQYKVFRRARFEVYSRLLHEALQELNRRAEENKLERLQTETLLRLALTLEQRLEQDTAQKLVLVDTQPHKSWNIHTEFLQSV
jgi:predicted negative regulator of RcsB-dependent stress response